ncbi:hypothetical protein OJF2_51430 [Aquisphaera giovannonii]|uniref:Uncharacterized protein n=1 Tax=Aquisphaera giovannonii TaxID=406548 RepID=A0A5B9W8S2_9BACT|nr:hypothetical protein [Aquisphaera giovannonii]QEH36559.1 hypothetical protein OJF2_51430 [Aquisphaera giovannonii]
MTGGSPRVPVRVVTEPEFHARLVEVAASLPADQIGSVTGPGRSGAVAAVYASHLLGVPFIPYGSQCPTHLGCLLIIDTARESGATLRKAERRYSEAKPIVVACFEEPPRVAF